MKIGKWIGIATLGAVIGVSVSMLTAAPATAIAYARCSQEVTVMERQAAKDYKAGRITADQYAAAQQRIANHRERWGC